MPSQPERPYEPEVEQSMRHLYESLSEKDRRRYAAVEAKKLGHGGVSYLAEVLGCSRHTIERGREELEQLPEDDAEGRVRRPGGGRKPLTESEPDLNDDLDTVLSVRTAGDPMHPEVVWTDLSANQISEQLEELGTSASPATVRKLLSERGLGRRKIQKTRPGGETPERNTQFELIFTLEDLYQTDGQPIFSMDTKKKEHLGRLYRDGRVWAEIPQQAFDHDFPTWAEGVIIPHGIYDPTLNHGHLNVGLSHDTSEFACDSFLWFWENWGRAHYPDATEILLECDAGGSNGCRRRTFKAGLQNVADTIGLPIHVAHYPSSCSKYNPIDRRFFPHVTRACEGVLFDSLETVVSLMRKATTRTGLETTVNVIHKAYETGRKVLDSVIDSLNLTHAPILPQWNYTLAPHDVA